MTTVLLEQTATPALRLLVAERIKRVAKLEWLNERHRLESIESQQQAELKNAGRKSLFEQAAGMGLTVGAAFFTGEIAARGIQSPKDLVEVGIAGTATGFGTKRAAPRVRTPLKARVFTLIEKAESEYANAWLGANGFPTLTPLKRAGSSLDEDKKKALLKAVNELFEEARSALSGGVGRDLTADEAHNIAHDLLMQQATREARGEVSTEMVLG